MTNTEKLLQEIAKQVEASKGKSKPKEVPISCPVDPAERALCEGCQ